VTTIVGIQTATYAILGSDTQITYGERAFCGDGQNKILNRNGIIFGVAGDAYAGQILSHLWSAPTLKSTKDLDGFVASVIVPSMRSVLSNNGYDPDKERGNDGGIDILLAISGRLYQLASDLTYFRDKNGFHAIGTGGDFSLGYLYSKKNVLEGTETTVAKTIRSAIQAASHFDINTGGGVDILYSRPKVKGS
jgi:ATP-dependent protease HslVU (ClpYQ) peptidase subunit